MRKSKIADAALVLSCFAALAYAFVELAPYRLGFKEQAGIFFLSPERWSWYVSNPAVLSSLAGDWLTQFLYSENLGIACLIILLMLLWDGLRRLFKGLGAECSPAVWALLPVAAQAACMVYLNWPVSAPVGLTMTVWAAVLLLPLLSREWTAYLLVLIIPLLFVLNGASALLIAAVAMFAYGKDFTKAILPSVAGLAIMLLLGRTYNLTLHQTFSWPVPLDYIVPGTLLRMAVPVSILAATVLALVCPVCWPGYALSVIAVAGSVFSMNDRTMETTVGIGTHAYRGEWSDVRHMAIADKTGGRVFRYYGNLSYAREDRLGDELFTLRQAGSPGLFLPMGKENGYLPIFFYIDGLMEMGDISQATDCALLGQTIMPGSCSTRMLRYLSEIAVITGDYDVAKKYLDILCKTRYHRDWASDLKACVVKDSIPQRYLKLRAKVARVDRMYPQADTEKALRTISDLNPENRTAVDYLLCSLLLDKRGSTFMGLYEKYWLDRLDRIYPIPKAYQEALLVNGHTLEDIREMADYYHISEEVRQNFSHFLQDKERANGRVGDLYEYRDTYWYYIISTKLNKE